MDFQIQEVFRTPNRQGNKTDNERERRPQVIG